MAVRNAGQDEECGIEYQKQAKALMHRIAPTSANPLPLRAVVKSDPFVF